MDDKVYGVWAVRSGNSMFGHAEAWCKDNGRVIEFDSKFAADAYAASLNEHATINCHYYTRAKAHERGAIAYGINGKAKETGQAASLPDNYLLNAELKEEAQTGNYNMLDGLMDNIAPDTAEEKSSVLDKLKAEKSPDEKEPPAQNHSAKEREL